MKTVTKMMIVAIVLLLVAGCNENLAVWGLATTHLDSQDNEFVGRLGVREENIEAGLESSYLGIHGRNQTYGGYVIMHLEGDPSSWLGRPFIGYHATVADSEDGGAYGPALGTVYWNVFVVEVQPLQAYTGKLSRELDDYNDENKLFTGAYLRF